MIRAYALDQPIGLPLAERWRAITALLVAVALGAAIAIGSFVWSHHVASVRARVQDVDARIAAAQAQIVRLRTELALRTRLVQQERWAPALGLQPSAPAQYVAIGAPLPALVAAPVRADPAPQIAPPHVDAASARPHEKSGYAARPRQEMDTLIADALR